MKGVLFRVPPFVVGMLIAAVFAAIVRWITGMPLWAAYVISIVALFVNGMFADWEDNRPGGFNNPL